MQGVHLYDVLKCLSKKRIKSEENGKKQLNSAKEIDYLPLLSRIIRYVCTYKNN